MRSRNISEAVQTGSDSQREIDGIHQQFKVDTWVRGAGCVGTLLVDLDVDRHSD